MNLDGWFTCGVCGKVLKQAGIELMDIEHPAPCCGTKGIRAVWPEKGHGPFEFVGNLDISTEEGSRAAAVFLCAALEAVLSKQLWFILTRLQTPASVALAIMDRCDTRGPMLELWAKLVGTPVQKAMESLKLGKWFSDWGTLTKARNGLAHGEWEVLEAADTLPALATRVRDGALASMAALQNYFVDEFAKQNHPPNQVEGFIVDLGKIAPVSLGFADEATWPPWRQHDWGDGHPQAQTYHAYPVRNAGKDAVLYIHMAERRDPAKDRTRLDSVLRRLLTFAPRTN